MTPILHTQRLRWRETGRLAQPHSLSAPELRYEHKQSCFQHTTACPPIALQTSRKRVYSSSLGPGRRPGLSPVGSRRKAPQQGGWCGQCATLLSGTGRLRESSWLPVFQARAGFSAEQGGELGHSPRFDLHTQPGNPGCRHCLPPQPPFPSPSCFSPAPVPQNHGDHLPASLYA